MFREIFQTLFYETKHHLISILIQLGARHWIFFLTLELSQRDRYSYNTIITETSGSKKISNSMIQASRSLISIHACSHNQDPQATKNAEDRQKD